MYNLIRTENFNTYLIRHFIIDDQSDLAQIVTDFQEELYPAWSASLATSGEKVVSYILANDLSTWTESPVTTIPY